MSERDYIWTLSCLSFFSLSLSLTILKLTGHPDMVGWPVVLGAVGGTLFCLSRTCLFKN